MKSIFAAAGLLATLAIAPFTSAQADVIYSVTQIGPTVAGPNAYTSGRDVPFTSSLQVIVTDEAAANGFSFSIPPQPSGGTPSIDGLVGILFQTFYEGRVDFSFTLSDFLAPPVPYYLLTLGLSASPEGLLSGNVFGRNGGTDNSMTFDGTYAVSGVINSDIINFICTQGNCTYQAVQTRTTVPEPMSIALFGAGLAGLAMVRRRKA